MAIKATRRAAKAPTTPFPFTDENIAALPFAKTSGGYVARDSKLAGFICQIGLKTKRLVFRTELREGGDRMVVYRRLGDPTHVKIDEARAQALEEMARITRRRKPESTAGMTFAEAWAEYLARLEKRAREGKASTRTIADYKQKFEANLTRLHKVALRDISRADARRLHADLTEDKGAYAANGSLRVAHAVYRYAATELEVPLPAANPFRPRDLFHEEQARQTGMSEKELPAFFGHLLAIGNPVHREFWTMLLLTGLRREDVESMRWEHVHLDDGSITIPTPKGGAARAFRCPISRPMRRCLDRVKRAGTVFAEEQAKTWVFPSPTSASGHIEEPKGGIPDRSPHALRHSFRAFCAGAKVTTVHSRLLMNHAITQDVHSSYMGVDSMFDQLRTASEEVAAYITKHLPKNAWRELDQRLAADLKTQRS
jgi:integrase